MSIPRPVVGNEIGVLTGVGQSEHHTSASSQRSVNPTVSSLFRKGPRATAVSDSGGVLQSLELIAWGTVAYHERTAGVVWHFA